MHQFTGAQSSSQRLRYPCPAVPVQLDKDNEGFGNEIDTDGKMQRWHAQKDTSGDERGKMNNRHKSLENIFDIKGEKRKSRKAKTNDKRGKTCIKSLNVLEWACVTFILLAEVKKTTWFVFRAISINALNVPDLFHRLVIDDQTTLCAYSC